MKHWPPSALAALVLVLLGAASANLGAATITVTSALDSGTGTLRAALASAANGDTIKFSLTKPAKITLSSGGFFVDKNLTILGPGAASLSLDGNASSSVFSISGPHTVLIAGLGITNGRGGISSDGATLTVSNCTISGSSASFGGGIYNYASSGNANLIVLDSTVSGNSANFGGGIVNLSQGGSAHLTIRNSTVSSNSADFAGGIWNIAQGGSAIASILNSTISGNSANYAGAIWNEAEGGGSVATLRLANSTLSGNSATSTAGGIWNYVDSGGRASLEIGSTILNAGASGANLVDEPGATVVSDGYNLSSDNGSGLLSESTDLINKDPMLGPLQNNGGLTFTHAPACNSPAIDHGTNFSTSVTDQRGIGFSRTFVSLSSGSAPGGDNTDIGALEVQAGVCDRPPLADASATPNLFISPNGSNATVVLNGSRSSDPDADSLQYNWSESGISLGSGVVALAVLPTGTHSIKLLVSDGVLFATNQITIEVITAADAVNRLAASLGSGVQHPQPLVASLRAALASIDRSNHTSAMNQLLAFQNKVRVQVGPLDSALAASLVQSAQDIIDSLDGGVANDLHPHFTSLLHQPNGRTKLQFTTEATGTYIVESSTNLVNWETIGVANSLSNGLLEFEDAHASGHPARFYRTVRP